MVKMDVNKGNISLEITGSMSDIVSELVYGISKIRDSMKEHSEESGDVFEALLKVGLTHVFAPEVCEKGIEEFIKALEEEDEDDDDDEDLIGDLIARLKEAKKK
jgi:adenine deaminase